MDKSVHRTKIFRIFFHFIFYFVPFPVFPIEMLTLTYHFFFFFFKPIFKRLSMILRTLSNWDREKGKRNWTCYMGRVPLHSGSHFMWLYVEYSYIYLNKKNLFASHISNDMICRSGTFFFFLFLSIFSFQLELIKRVKSTC